MINKEHYQIIRRHPAFAHFLWYSKIAVGQFRKIPKGLIAFSEIVGIVFHRYVRIEQYDSTMHIWIILKWIDVFPYGYVFDERYHYTASAVTQCHCFSIPMDLFEDLFKKDVDQLLFITSVAPADFRISGIALTCRLPAKWQIFIYFMHGSVQRGRIHFISNGMKRVGQVEYYTWNSQSGSKTKRRRVMIDYEHKNWLE